MTQSMNPSSHEIELSVEELQEKVKLGAAAVKLMQNEEFRTVIIDGYTNDELTTALEDRTHSAMQAPHAQAHILARMDGVAYFTSWLKKVISDGQQADQALDELRRMHEERVLEEASE